MVRDDTAIRGTDHGQLSAGHGKIVPRLGPGGRRRVKSKQHESPIWGRQLDNTISSNKNNNHAAPREIDPEYFWNP